MARSKRHRTNGSIERYETKNGPRWAIRWYQADIGSQPKQHRKRGFSDQQAAECELLRITLLIAEGKASTPQTMTLEAWARSWIPTRHTRGTRDLYEGLMRNHVLPVLGTRVLGEITTRAVNTLYTRLQAPGYPGGRGSKRQGGRPLGPATVKRINTMLDTMFQDAVEHDPPLMAANPLKSKKLLVPREADIAQRAKPITCWTKPQLDAFTQWESSLEPDADPLADAWILFTQTGLRRGELAGLQWGDISPDAKRITVRRSLVNGAEHGTGNRPRTNPPKSGKPRTILLGRRATDVLEHRRAACGTHTRSEDWVFTDHQSQPWKPDHIYRALPRQIRRYNRTHPDAQLPILTPHGLRHTHATLLMAAGVPTKAVSERLGHHSPAFTAKQYFHVGETLQEAAATALDD